MLTVELEAMLRYIDQGYRGYISEDSWERLGGVRLYVNKWTGRDEVALVAFKSG